MHHKKNFKRCLKNCCINYLSDLSRIFEEDGEVIDITISLLLIDKRFKTSVEVFGFSANLKKYQQTQQLP